MNIIINPNKESSYTLDYIKRRYQGNYIKTYRIENIIIAVVSKAEVFIDTITIERDIPLYKQAMYMQMGKKPQNPLMRYRPIEVNSNNCRCLLKVI